MKHLKMMSRREARSGREASTQNKRIREVAAGFEHEGDIVHAGWAGRGAGGNQVGGRRGPRGDS